MTSTSIWTCTWDLDVTSYFNRPHNDSHKKHQRRRTAPAKMLSTMVRSAMTQALRTCGHGLQAKSLLSRGVLVRRSFLVAPGYKSRVAARGFATATASKTTGGTAAKKPATKTKTKTSAKAKAKATTTRAKKTAKAPAKKKKAAAKPKKPVVKKKKKEVSPEKQKLLLKRQLKKTALLNQEPKNLPMHPWLVFVSRSFKSESLAGEKAGIDRMPAISAEYKGLSSAELEVSIPISPTSGQRRSLTEPSISVCERLRLKTRRSMQAT